MAKHPEVVEANQAYLEACDACDQAKAALAEAEDLCVQRWKDYLEMENKHRKEVSNG